MKIGFIYAGQGSQRVGMGKDFYEECDSYKSFIDSLDEEIKTMMHEGPIEKLTDTKNNQRCMPAFAAGVTKLLLENGVKPDVTAGLSLGEYGALHAAGVFDAKTYVEITTYRGKVMAEAALNCTCKMSMSAVLGLESDAVVAACEQYMNEKSDDSYVTVANFNCPGQYVICGDEAAVEKTEAILKEKGAKRCVRLNVSGPFHTKFMASAGDKLGDFLKDVELKKAELPVLMNITGNYLKDEDDLKNLMVRQVSNSVRFEDEIRKMISDGVDTFVEIGPGNTLTGFVKKTAKAVGAEVTTYSIDSLDDYKKVIEEIGHTA